MAGIEPASREFDLGCTTSLVGLLLFAQASPDQQGLAQARQSELLISLALMLLIAIQSIAPRFSMASDPGLSGKTWADVAALRQPGRVEVRQLSLLPLFCESRAPRLAIPGQPSLSKPFIPKLPLNYSTLLDSPQLQTPKIHLLS